jgi:hypothetical protein
MSFRCLVCSELGFEQQPDGSSFELCWFCGWQDDTTDPDEPSGANGGYTMIEYRRTYLVGPQPPRRTRSQLPRTDTPAAGGLLRDGELELPGGKD